MRVIIAIASRRAAHANNNDNDKRHQEYAAHNADQYAEKWPDILDYGRIGEREIWKTKTKTQKYNDVTHWVAVKIDDSY